MNEVYLTQTEQAVLRRIAEGDGCYERSEGVHEHPDYEVARDLQQQRLVAVAEVRLRIPEGNARAAIVQVLFAPTQRGREAVESMLK